MFVTRRWLLILCMLLFSGGQLFAASHEERSYAAILYAFQSKFYSQVTNRLGDYLKTYQKSTNAPAAILLLAQADFYLKNYSNVTNLLTDPANLTRATTAGMADGYFYWLAEAQFAQGEVARAAETFSSLAKEFPNSRLALSSVVEAAAAFEKLGKWHEADALLDDTNGVFQRTARLNQANEGVYDGQLLRAESKCAQGDFVAAIQVLDLLARGKLTPEQDWKRADLLYRANLGRNNLEAALAATTNMLAIAREGQGEAWATNLAESVACNASVLEQQGQLAAATTALQANLATNVPAGQLQHTVLKLAELAVAQNQLQDAETRLEGFLTQFPDSPAAPVTVLTLGELHLRDFIAQPSDDHDLTNALAKLNQFLAISTNAPLAGKAFLDRGWCDWESARLARDSGDAKLAAQKITDSLADFRSAAQCLPKSDDLAVARFKMGDAQFELKDFAGAQTNYEAVLTDFSAFPDVYPSLGCRALYQILRARLALHDVAEVDDTMQKLLKDFSTNAATESSLLLGGEGISDFGSPAKARQVFREFETQRTNSPLMPQVAFAAARTYEREQNWSTAANEYADWLRSYPTNKLRPQVEYARSWAVSQTGDENGAFELFTNFAGRYPTNRLTPLALWWVADHYLRMGSTNIVDAERHYEWIFQNFPAGELAFRAQLMAGQAALERFGYSDAKTYFRKLIDTNCPEGIRDQARFGYCEALRQIAPSETNNASLQEATNVLAQMCPMSATNLDGALAWSEMGDIDRQMGDYDAATNAYAQALASPVATDELKSRARVGWGLVLEKKAESAPADAKKGMLDMAMENYQGVFASENENQTAYWRMKAGYDLLSLNAKTGTLKGKDLENFITEFQKIFPQLKDSAELRRLTKAN